MKLVKIGLRALIYLLFFVICAIGVPYFFKQHPFFTMSALLILSILVMRRDFMELPQ